VIPPIATVSEPPSPVITTAPNDDRRVLTVEDCRICAASESVRETKRGEERRREHTQWLARVVECVAGDSLGGFSEESLSAKERERGSQE
jgi:hypothetical protein